MARRKIIPHPNRFNFDTCIEAIIDLGFAEMFRAIDGECGRVEAMMTGRGGPQARADGGGEYVARLKKVAFGFIMANPYLAAARR